MISQREADRICKRANQLEDLRNDLRAIDNDDPLVDELTHTVWMLRRYVCGGLVMEFDRHNFILQRKTEFVTSILEA